MPPVVAVSPQHSGAPRPPALLASAAPHHRGRTLSHRRLRVFLSPVAASVQHAGRVGTALDGTTPHHDLSHLLLHAGVLQYRDLALDYLSLIRSAHVDVVPTPLD